MPTYRFLGSHADTVYEGNKAIPVGPGDFVDLSEDAIESDTNKFLREGGQLLVVTGSAKASQNRQLRAVGAKDDTKEVKD